MNDEKMIFGVECVNRLYTTRGPDTSHTTLKNNEIEFYEMGDEYVCGVCLPSAYYSLLSFYSGLLVCLPVCVPVCNKQFLSMNK